MVDSASVQKNWIKDGSTPTYNLPCSAPRAGPYTAQFKAVFNQREEMWNAAMQLGVFVQDRPVIPRGNQAQQLKPREEMLPIMWFMFSQFGPSQHT